MSERSGTISFVVRILPSKSWLGTCFDGDGKSVVWIVLVSEGFGSMFVESSSP